jgi:hypothetical protein
VYTNTSRYTKNAPFNKKYSLFLDQLDKFCESKGFVGWFDTSAKMNINIDKAARFLVERILGHQDIFQKKRATQVRKTTDDYTYFFHLCVYICMILFMISHIYASAYTIIYLYE